MHLHSFPLHDAIHISFRPDSVFLLRLNVANHYGIIAKSNKIRGYLYSNVSFREVNRQFYGRKFRFTDCFPPQITVSRAVISFFRHLFIWFSSKCAVLHSNLQDVDAHDTRNMSQLMRLWYLSHRRPAKAQASLCMRTVPPEPSLFAHIKYGNRRWVRPKIRHLAPLDGCACSFEKWVYGGRKVP